MATSHAEPMARNNTRELVGAERAEFNCSVNRDAILDYGKERATEANAWASREMTRTCLKSN